MNRIMVYAVLLVTLITLCVFQAIAEEGPALSEEELANKAASVSSVNPEEVKRMISALQEATAFFSFMSYQNMLPSTPNDIVKRFEATMEPSEYSIKYPLKVVIDIDLKGASHGYQKYTLEKSAVNKPWKVLSGYQLDTRKKKIADLKLPSQENQKKANDKVPILMKNINTQE
ncbi:MAG: hypothetical protein ACM3MD_00480 [Betaproteobacteria bacterium]